MVLREPETRDEEVPVSTNTIPRGAATNRATARTNPEARTTMATLRDIMSTDLVTLTPEARLREAIEVLRGSGITGAPVVAGDRVVGVLSANDVLESEVDTPPVPSERPAQVEWGGLEDEDESLKAEAGEVPPAAFFIGMWSDAGGDVLERFEDVEGPEWDVLEDVTVGEAMTPTVYSRGPDTPLPEAAAFMLETGVHRILVMEGDRLLGIVSTTDIVRAVAEGRV